MIQKGLDNESVSDGVNGRDIDGVEFQGWWFPVGLELIIPRSPVFLLLVNIVIKDCV
jgi:hypothetical protein